MHSAPKHVCRNQLEIAPSQRSNPRTTRSIGTLNTSQTRSKVVTEGKRALELDPVSALVNVNLAGAFYWARQYDAAIEQARRTLELDPNSFLAHFMMGLSYLQESMYNEATAELEKGLAISPGNALPRRSDAPGRKGDAQKALYQLIELSKTRYVPAEMIARIYSGLGQKDKAFEWLEKGFDDRSTYDINAYAMVDPLRSDPRFEDLLRRMNLQS
jgi:tetratricopeptide (TPR) repeat protein